MLQKCIFAISFFNVLTSCNGAERVFPWGGSPLYLGWLYDSGIYNTFMWVVDAVVVTNFYTLTHTMKCMSAPLTPRWVRETYDKLSTIKLVIATVEWGRGPVNSIVREHAIHRDPSEIFSMTQFFSDSEISKHSFTDDVLLFIRFFSMHYRYHHGSSGRRQVHLDHFDFRGALAFHPAKFSRYQ